MSATAPGDAIVQQVDIQAPAKRIFKALANPEELLKWWRAEGKFQAVRVESELRPGGRWTMLVSGSCATDPATKVSGRYHTIEPPRLLIYTWIREEDQAETVVRWDLEERGGVTTVRLTHSGLTTDRLRTRNNGWPLILALLQAHTQLHIEGMP